MERLDINARSGGVRVGLRPKHPGSSFLKLRLPLRDLVGMDVELLRQVGKRLLAPNLTVS
jgi:hypothetical protein